MKEKNQVLTRGFLIILSFVFLGSCASIPELKVNYALPPKSGILQGKQLFLAVRDSRPKDDILGEGASTELRNFPGNLTLNVARDSETAFKIGIFQVPALVEEVFRRRLENEGMNLSNNRSLLEPELLIVLNELSLDLVNRKWVVKMNYEAELIMDGKVLSTRIISGGGERYMVFGLPEANVVLGEVITDMVNVLDVERLLQDAGL